MFALTMVNHTDKHLNAEDGTRSVFRSWKQQLLTLGGLLSAVHLNLNEALKGSERT